ncbi:flagellar hook-basal body complex protein FliE [Paenibacillus cellulosilyticus]|uniref:Flagellar hook-basal body complex protein FliE n=1 Tax=Paenibacillus cellulosilyticus TaxID=375489 RepID=A0A2V2YYN6_9BACL|nr:flagellar hook-basal body complex protein FliE [Paenibacillus cellulosilyticus]PWW06391.1 flagellar hook-basal body complex protein FliE [Paenibacillus cellulosilyticus]QKS46262.1 flagellar hook-basal body complex protein FliE [Paenibacillus cellulosilyticus]
MIQSLKSIPIQSIQTSNALTSNVQATPAEVTQSFGDFLQQAIEGVSAQEKEAQATTVKFMAGQADVSQVMIASQQAELSLQLTSQIRNRVVEAYQEIMRTQL